MEPNLGIGNYIRRNLPQISVVYYITSQVWISLVTGWYISRVIAVYDRILSIFPEEARYFQSKGANISWV